MKKLFYFKYRCSFVKFIFKGENDVSLSTVNSEMIQCSSRTEA